MLLRSQDVHNQITRLQQLYTSIKHAHGALALQAGASKKAAGTLTEQTQAHAQAITSVKNAHGLLNVTGLAILIAGLIQLNLAVLL